MSLTILIGRKHTSGPPPDPVPGDPLGGGYYIGNIVIGGNIYRVIIAPKSAETSLVYKTTASADTGNTSLNDGFTNSQALNDALHPAIQYCRSYTGGGFTDWYMGARDEMELFYRYLKASGDANSTGQRTSLGAGAGNIGNNPNSYPIGADYTSNNPAQTPVALFRSGGAQAADLVTYYKTSTNAIGSGWDGYSIVQRMDSGAQTGSAKSNAQLVRPVRKILVGPAPAGPNIGDAYEGGYFAGQITVNGTLYNLVLSPKSTETTLAWKTSATLDTIALSLVDGLANSNALNSATYPAAQYCRSLTTGGKTDWFLPARDQLELLYRNFKSGTSTNWTSARDASTGGGANGANANSVPIGAGYTTTVPAQTSLTDFQVGGAQAIGGNSAAIAVWSSSNNQNATAGTALSQDFATTGTTGGWQSGRTKNLTAIVRAVRMVPA